MPSRDRSEDKEFRANRNGNVHRFQALNQGPRGLGPRLLRVTRPVRLIKLAGVGMLLAGTASLLWPPRQHPGPTAPSLPHSAAAVPHSVSPVVPPQAAGQAQRNAGTSVNAGASGYAGTSGETAGGAPVATAEHAPEPLAISPPHAAVAAPEFPGADVVVVNLPGVPPGQLHLTGEILAAIYLGAIRRWDDPRIQAVNPGLALPGLPIAPLYRADGAVANLVFTAYLSMTSTEWRRTVGANLTVAWPAGSGARGAGAVAYLIGRIPGSIGFVEAAVAPRHHLATARLPNAAGRFIAPTPESLAASAESTDWTATPSPTLRLVNPACDTCWPLFASPSLVRPGGAADPAGASHDRTLQDWRENNRRTGR